MTAADLGHRRRSSLAAVDGAQRLLQGRSAQARRARAQGRAAASRCSALRGVPRPARRRSRRDAARRRWARPARLAAVRPGRLRRAHAEERRARSRACARPFSKWSSITTPARCAGVSSPGRTRARELDALDVATLTGLLAEIDEESRALLAAYLDRRDAGWRDDAQDDAAAGRSSGAAQRQNDGTGGLSDPWPSAGRERRRHRARPSHADEETPPRPRGVDVPCGPRQRGQGHVFSAAIADYSNATLALAAPAPDTSLVVCARRQFLSVKQSTSLRFRYLHAASAWSWSSPAKRAR